MSKNEKKGVNTIQDLDDRFDADIAPVYPKVRGRFLKQGHRSFLHEFYRLYRRWVKND
jgi:hypothetical protein